MGQVGDWTRDDHGTTNASESFVKLVGEVRLVLIGAGGQLMSASWAENTAHTIVSHLAHGFGVGPLDPPIEDAELVEPDIAAALAS